jgi:hypothetical protein
MKQIKKLFSLAIALLLCLVPLFGNTMTVNAAGEPTTYYIKYVDSIGQWRYQVNGWDDNQYTNVLENVSLYIKDGDHVAIDGSGFEQGISLQFDVNLGSLTFTSTKSAVIVQAKSVDNLYGVNGAIGVINAPVKNAYVYDNTVLQFNGDVDYLEIIASKDDTLRANVFVQGVAKHLKAYSKSYTHFEFYDFEKGTLSINNGALKTATGLYSATPSAAAPTTPSTPSAPTSTGEYDDVPKTGDIRFNPLWLVALAAACFAGSYALKKEN